MTARVRVYRLCTAGNPAMVEWSLQADDLYAGVMVVDLFLDQFRIALSDDFATYVPVADVRQLCSRGWLNR
jgi:hypothetical protein